ncbi:MAG: LysR family transcriptional regulator [Rhodoferax sp.]|nr:LysR family transcriptional regulator [Rhodoferax sp.]
MNLQRLESFLLVAQCGSFGQASESLHRSQSAVSKHIQQLEADLGVPLLERTTRRVSITAEGRLLLDRSKGALAELRAIAGELRDHSLLRRGRVSIGAVPSISSHRLPQTIAAFQKRHPGISIELHEGYAERIYQDLQERATDFAVAPAVIGLAGFEFRPVVTDRFVAVVPRTDELVDAASATLATLATRPMLCMGTGSALRASVEDAFRLARLRLAPAIEVSHHQTLLGMVSAGLGVAVLPRLCVPEGRQHAYAVIVIKGTPIQRDIGIVTLKGKTPTPAAARCAQMVSDALAKSKRH